MYIPKDINRCLTEEAKRAGRTNMEGLVVAPLWSKLFLQANYVIAKQADEIERLREALEEIMHYDVAWHSEAVGTVDGPCAALARSALQQKDSE